MKRSKANALNEQAMQMIAENNKTVIKTGEQNYIVPIDNVVVRIPRPSPPIKFYPMYPVAFVDPMQVLSVLVESHKQSELSSFYFPEPYYHALGKFTIMERVPEPTNCSYEHQLLLEEHILEMFGFLMEKVPLMKLEPYLKTEWPQGNNRDFAIYFCDKIDKFYKNIYGKHPELLSSLGFDLNLMSDIKKSTTSLTPRTNAYIDIDLNPGNLLLPFGGRDGRIAWVDPDNAMIGDPLLQLVFFYSAIPISKQEQDDRIQRVQSRFPSKYTNGWEADIKYYRDIQQAILLNSGLRQLIDVVRKNELSPPEYIFDKINKSRETFGGLEPLTTNEILTRAQNNIRKKKTSRSLPLTPPNNKIDIITLPHRELDD